jgi:hypothetical protein
VVGADFGGFRDLINRQLPGLAGGAELFSDRGHFVLFSAFAGGLAIMEIKRNK